MKKYLKMALPMLGFAILASTAQAENVYTCKNKDGDSVHVMFRQNGQEMMLRSVYKTIKLKREKQVYAPGWIAFKWTPPVEGYETGYISVTAPMLKGSAAGEISFGDDYNCKLGVGKLVVSQATKDAVNPPPPPAEPCKLSSYMGSIRVMPPRLVCDYGDGFVVEYGRGAAL